MARVIVLGGSGFIGSWSIRALLGGGHDTVAIARPSSNVWRIDGLDGLRIERADPDDWPALIAAAAPDAVVSLDWAGVAGAAKNDDAQWANLERQRSVVAATARAGARRFVGVGSQAEYGSRGGATGEDADPAPATEYGKAKVAALEAVRADAKRLGIEWCWARVFSTFGPLDNDTWVLPQVAAAIRGGHTMNLSSGRQRWTYLAGRDAGEAFALLATHPEAQGVINVAHPDAPPLRSSIEIFAAAVDGPGSVKFKEPSSEPVPPPDLVADVRKLQSLGWRARRGELFAADLHSTAAWFGGATVDDHIGGRALPAYRANRV